MITYASGMLYGACPWACDDPVFVLFYSQEPVPGAYHPNFSYQYGLCRVPGGTFEVWKWTLYIYILYYRT